jgi:hypothetical protein
MRSRYTIREPGVPYFITCTVVQWIPLFTRKPYFDILIDCLQQCGNSVGADPRVRPFEGAHMGAPLQVLPSA